MGILLELLKIFSMAFKEGLKLFVGIIVYTALVIMIIILFKELYRYLKTNLGKRGKIYAYNNKDN